MEEINSTHGHSGSIALSMHKSGVLSRGTARPRKGPASSYAVALALRRLRFVVAPAAASAATRSALLIPERPEMS